MAETSIISPQRVPVIWNNVDPIPTKTAVKPIIFRSGRASRATLKIMSRPTTIKPMLDHVLAGSTTQPHRRRSQNSIAAGSNRLQGQDPKTKTSAASVELNAEYSQILTFYASLTKYHQQPSHNEAAESSDILRCAQGDAYRRF